MRTSYSFRLLAASLVAATALAGCSSGGDGDSAGADTGADTQQAAGGSGADTESGSDAEPADTGAVAPADLANFVCDRMPDGRWNAKGHVTNSTGKPMTYTITVVTTDDAEQVVGERATSFELRPEETKPFTFPGFYRGPAAGCMPHVERAAA